MTSRGCGRVRPIRLPKDSVGSVREECSQSSLTILKLPEPGSGSTDLDELNLLMQMVMFIGKEIRAQQNQLIENLLVDASIASKTY